MSEEARKGRRYVKRRDGAEVVRVPAGGGFDEWIDIRRPAMEHFERTQLRLIGDDSRLIRLHMAALIIVDWSLTDESGDKLPITFDEIASGDAEMSAILEPVLDRVNDFLAARVSAMMNAEKSKTPAEDTTKPASLTDG